MPLVSDVLNIISFIITIALIGVFVYIYVSHRSLKKYELQNTSEHSNKLSEIESKYITVHDEQQHILDKIEDLQEYSQKVNEEQQIDINNLNNTSGYIKDQFYTFMNITEEQSNNVSNLKKKVDDTYASIYKGDTRFKELNMGNLKITDKDNRVDFSGNANFEGEVFIGNESLQSKFDKLQSYIDTKILELRDAYVSTKDLEKPNTTVIEGFEATSNADAIKLQKEFTQQIAGSLNIRDEELLKAVTKYIENEVKRIMPELTKQITTIDTKLTKLETTDANFTTEIKNVHDKFQSSNSATDEKIQAINKKIESIDSSDKALPNSIFNTYVQDISSRFATVNAKTENLESKIDGIQGQISQVISDAAIIANNPKNGGGEGIFNKASVTSDLKVGGMTTINNMKGKSIDADSINTKGGKSIYNKGGAATHFPWKNGTNYIRGDTNLDGIANIKETSTNKLHLGNKFTLSGVGDKHGNDGWLRLFKKEGTKGEGDYYGGLAAGELWSKTNVFAGDSINVGNSINTKGGKSKHNPGNWGTHFPWAGDGKNYIRGDTEIRGDAYIIGDAQVGGVISKGDIIMQAAGNKANNWILHRPNDGRKSLYIARNNGKGWDWGKGLEIDGNSGDIRTNGNININRHIDAKQKWGKGTALFAGWGTDKTIIGNHKTGGHDYALNAPNNSVVSATPHYFANDIHTNNGRTIHNNGRLHIHPQERLYILPKQGVHITKDWGASGNLDVHGSTKLHGDVHVTRGIDIQQGDPGPMIEKKYGNNDADRYGVSQHSNGRTYLYAAQSHGPSTVNLGYATGKDKYNEVLTVHKNKITEMHGNAHVRGDIIMDGRGNNNWIIHTPHDGRKSMYIARNNGKGWDWGRGLELNGSTGDIQVKGNTYSGKLKLSNGWTGYPDDKKDGAEISNDTGQFKQLMIVGNKAAGKERRVGIWDRLDVHGQFCIGNTCINEHHLRVLTGQDPVTIRARHTNNKLAFNGQFGNRNRGPYETMYIEPCVLGKDGWCKKRTS